jgi:protein required for attachment to host cells
MPQHRKIWFVVADGSRARIVTRPAEATGYEIVAEYEAPQVRRPSRDIVSDRPGRAQESASPARHAVEPRQDPHRAAKESFLCKLADELDRANERGAFDQLVLYADPHSLAVLRQKLNETTRAKVAAEFPKDLTKVPLPELDRHLESTPRPAG